jgi:predicted transcriptional regulator
MPQPTTFRLDDATDQMIDALAASLGLSRIDVLRLAVRKLHRAEGLPAVPTEVPHKKGGR